MLYKIVNGAVSYDGETVLENIDFEVKDREKIALVGRNGCGKSTLLKAMIGKVELEEGTGEQTFQVVRLGSPSIGYLEQMTFDSEDISMLDGVKKAFSPILEAEKRLAELVELMKTSSEQSLINEFSALTEKFERLGGYTYQKEYTAMIKSFGFTEADKMKPISAFSGGQRTKIAFMKLLLSKPDILLLDEPTNHLDVTAVKWLEDYLRAYKSALVVVSHDRYFLDRVVGKVYEIEYGETHAYIGNYTEFERLKREEHEKRRRDHDRQQAEIKRITALIERFRYKATKAKMVQSKIKLLERMKLIDAPDRYDTRTFRANFEPEYESGRRVLRADKLVIGYDKPLCEVSFELMRGERLGIIGANGIGKSTLLKTLVGSLPPLEGSYEYGVNVKTGYFDQQLAALACDSTLFDDFSRAFPSLTDSEVRSALGAFEFSGEDVFRPIGTLSGGERVRYTLCKILRRRPNLLLLDEPTNHMDIIGKETLENMLTGYSGTLMFVSHDRYFVNKLADKLLVFDQTGTHFLDMTYAEYEQREHEREAAASAAETARAAAAPDDNSPRVSKPRGNFSPLKEKGKLERRIATLEIKISALEAEMSAQKARLEDPEVYSDFEKITEIEAELSGREKTHAALCDEWANLSESLEALGI